MLDLINAKLYYANQISHSIVPQTFCPRFAWIFRKNFPCKTVKIQAKFAQICQFSQKLGSQKFSLRFTWKKIRIVLFRKNKVRIN